MLNNYKKDALPDIKKNKKENNEKMVILKDSTSKDKQLIDKIFDLYVNDFKTTFDENFRKIEKEVKLGLKTYFQLLQANDFKNKYKDYEHYKDEEKDKNKELEYLEKIERLFNDKFQGDFKELDKIIDKNKLELKIERFKKYKRRLKSAAIHFLKLNLSLIEVLSFIF
jgi:hypothetical protein